MHLSLGITAAVVSIPISLHPLIAYVAIVPVVPPGEAYYWQGEWILVEEALGFYAQLNLKKARALLECNAPVTFEVKAEIANLVSLGLERIITIK